MEKLNDFEVLALWSDRNKRLQDNLERYYFDLIKKEEILLLINGVNEVFNEIKKRFHLDS